MPMYVWCIRSVGHHVMNLRLKRLCGKRSMGLVDTLIIVGRGMKRVWGAKTPQ